MLPARVRKPRVKAKVEGGVLVVERWILAAYPRAKERAQRFTRRVHGRDKHIAVIDQHLDRVLERAFVIGPAFSEDLTAREPLPTL